VRVADLPGIPGLGLRLLARGGQDRQVRRVYTTDLPDPGRYLSGGELVLTGLIWCRAAGDTDRFTAALARAGAAALAAGEALGPVPEELVRCCARLGLPLLAVPAETSFGTVTDEIMRRLAGDRSGTMDRVLGRRRQLLSAITEGGGLDALFRLSGTDLRAGCWLLTATGRQLAGTEGSLPGTVAMRLARQYLAGGRLPAAVRAVGKDYTLLAARPYRIWPAWSRSWSCRSRRGRRSAGTLRRRWRWSYCRAAGRPGLTWPAPRSRARRGAWDRSSPIRTWPPGSGRRSPCSRRACAAGG
jgi:hypothetical protein